MKLSKIVEWVHSQAKWQDESCFETKIHKVHETLVIANHNNYGDKEKCMDTVILEQCPNNTKMYRLCIVENNEIDLTCFMQGTPFYMDKLLYLEYVIENDLKEKTENGKIN